MQLYLGNCLDFIQEMPDQSVDAIITDPPYAATDLGWDNLFVDWLEPCLRILKPNGYLATFGLENLQYYVSKVYKRRWSGIWLKEKGTMRTHSAKKPMSQCEPYIVYCHPNAQIKLLTYNHLTIPGEPYRKIQKTRGI